MPALDAFHSKQEAFTALHDPGWSRFADGFTGSLRGEAQDIGVTDYTETGRELTTRLVRTLNMAEAFYVAPLMHRLVTAAADDWPHDETVEAEDWPVPYGWMFLPGRGLTTIDVRGVLSTVTAISWEARADHVDLVWWVDKRFDPPHIKTREGWELMPRFTPWHITHLKFGSTLPLHVQMGTVLPPEVSDSIVWNKTEGGMSAFIPEGWSKEQLAPTAQPDRISAWLVSALRIMQQPLAAVEHAGLPTNVRKALRRERWRVKQTNVTVVDFRRRESDFHQTSEREYSHRFLRRGHWRRQPYKRDDGSWDRRRIWIHATIVGDPDKPLILRNHVYSLSR